MIRSPIFYVSAHLFSQVCYSYTLSVGSNLDGILAEVYYMIATKKVLIKV